MADELSATTEKSAQSDVSKANETGSPKIPSNFLPYLNKKKYVKAMKDKVAEDQKRKLLLEQRDRQK
jgi:protoheme ferro-lyase